MTTPRAQAGLRLRVVREAWRRTQAEMAEIVGVHRTAWSMYERGLRFPDLLAVQRIAAKLRLTIGFIYDGELAGLETDVATHIAAHHPELVAWKGKAPRKGD
jgi:DNA-binding XRE family transcriptional regulator